MKKKKIFIFIAVLMILESMIIGSLIIYQKRQDSYEHYVKVAQKYLSEEDYEQAIVEFNKAIEKNPQLEYAYLGLSGVYVRMEEYDEAIGVLQNGYDETQIRSLRRKMDNIKKKSEDTEIETAVVDEPIQAEDSTKELAYMEEEITSEKEEVILDDNGKEFLEEMCTDIPEFKSIYSVDDYFWWRYLINAVIRVFDYSNSIETEDGKRYMYISEEDINDYTNQMFAIDFPGIDCEAEYNKHKYLDGEVQYEVYYDNGYYYMIEGDNNNVCDFQVDNIEQIGFNRYRVTCGEYFEGLIANHIFEIDLVDNDMGFIITSHEIISLED